MKSRVKCLAWFWVFVIATAPHMCLRMRRLSCGWFVTLSSRGSNCTHLETNICSSVFSAEAHTAIRGATGNRAYIRSLWFENMNYSCTKNTLTYCKPVMKRTKKKSSVMIYACGSILHETRLVIRKQPRSFISSFFLCCWQYHPWSGGIFSVSLGTADKEERKGGRERSISWLFCLR